MKKAYVYDYSDCLFNFEEMFSNVVTYGNRDYINLNQDEEHWEAFHYMYEDVSYMDKEGFVENGDYNYSKEQLESIWNMFEKYNWNKNRSAEEVIPYMFPNEQFEFVTLRGYCQSDWIYAMLVNEDTQIDTNVISDYFFGNVHSVKIVDGEYEYWDEISHSEFWQLERKGKDELLKYFEVDDIVKMESRQVVQYFEVDF